MTEKMEWIRAPKKSVIEKDRIEITTEPHHKAFALTNSSL